jgi:hypothetical protein
MAEDRFVAGGTPREGWLFPHIFRTFRVALDPKKLLLAAAGIVTMALGWWLLSVVFYSAKSKPVLPAAPNAADVEREYPNKSATEREQIVKEKTLKRNREYNEDCDRWLELHYLAGAGIETVTYEPEDDKPSKDDKPPQGKTVSKWGGRLRTMPWYEDRGPNPYLLVTDKTRRPWETGRFWDWAIHTEVPVLIEPLVKFLEPIVYLLSPKSGTYTRIYLLLIVLWTLATWAFFGGAITRMATVELAGKDPVSISEALRFVYRRYASYLLGPIVPLGLVAVLVIVSIIFGLFHMIPAVGDILVDGLLWPFIILIGLGMALLLVGLVGYPLMYPTISAEGSDTLDALSRSYNYVYQSPWSYISYSLLAILYGAVVIFFVGFMGSLTVYLGKWAIGNTPFIKTANRSPEYLFIYSPTSFGWREVLVSDSRAEKITRMKDEEQAVLHRRDVDADVANRLLAEKWRLENRDRGAAQADYDNWLDTFYVYNSIGAAMVSFWITLVFLLVLGFGYSFFWTCSSMIYLMMRRKVDDIDIDEVYLEETEPVDPFAGMPTTPSPAATAPPVASTGTIQMQESLSVRNDHPTPPTPAPEIPAPAPPPAGETTP